MSNSSRGRGWMLVLGAVVIVAGLVGAGALWYASGQRVDDNVADFARAPSGCATTLDFARTGEFTVYVETTGSFDDLAGDCAADTEYDRDEVADPQIQLVDAGGAAVDISDTTGVSYDTGAFAGSSVGVVQIETPGEHLLTVVGRRRPVRRRRRRATRTTGSVCCDGVRWRRRSCRSSSEVSCSCSAVGVRRGRRSRTTRSGSRRCRRPRGPSARPDSRLRRRRPGRPGPPAHRWHLPRERRTPVAPPPPMNPSPWAPPSISNGA